jgi:hypothetical protein
VRRPDRAIARLLLLLAAAPLGGAEARPAPSPAGPRVVVGPNVLVSRDGDVPHVELMLATSPRTAKHLLGGAITATRPAGGVACRAYSSTDGGSTWKASEFPEQVEWGGADPQVAWTARGTALFVALTSNKSEKGKDCSSMHVWRSEDAGRTWLPATEIPCNPSWDHEQIVVDYTAGRFAGRIYMAALYDYPVYRVGVFRSDDDGRSWTGPVEAANGGGTIGINGVTPMVLSDGTLVVPYGDFPFLPDKRPKEGTVTLGNLWTVSSTDGGITFSKPAKVVGQRYFMTRKNRKPLGGFPKFATSGASKNHPDRLYVVWEDYNDGPYRLLFARSTDRGRTWSAPRPLDAKVAAGTHQYQPAIATNADGVVAITWFDTRESRDGSEYHQYFTASADGGETFLPTVQVSSAPSRARGAGNRQVTPTVWSDADGIYLSMLSATSRYESGGDYMGLAADRDGAFHPFWADSRTGTFQIYTARVAVELPPKPEEGGGGGGGGKAAAAAPAKKPEPARAEASLAGKVDFVFDPTRLDVEKNELEIPVRLVNVSNQPIYPPIRVEITGFGFPKYESEEDKKRNAENAPSAVNASNGKAKEGAIFDFGPAIAGSEALEPGAQTNPVVMRFRLVDPDQTPSLTLKAVGMLSTAP